MSTDTHSSVVAPETAPKDRNTRIIESSGNVFVDLGFDPAEAEALKLQTEAKIRTAKQFATVTKRPHQAAHSAR